MCTICEEEVEIFTQLATRHETWRMPDDYTEEELAAHKSRFKPHEAWLETSMVLSDENYRAYAASLLRNVRIQASKMSDKSAPLYLRSHALAENLRFWFLLLETDRNRDQLSHLVARYLTKMINRHRELLDSTFERAYPLLSKVLHNLQVSIHDHEVFHSGEILAEARRLYEWLNTDWMHRLKSEYREWDNLPNRERERSEINGAVPFLWIGLLVLSSNKEIDILKPICQTGLFDLHGRNHMQITRAGTSLLQKSMPPEAFQQWVLSCPPRIQLFSSLVWGTSAQTDAIEQTNFFDRENGEGHSYFGAAISLI